MTLEDLVQNNLGSLLFENIKLNAIITNQKKEIGELKEKLRQKLDSQSDANTDT